MRNYSGYFENYFGQGPIFFLIDKSQPVVSDSSYIFNWTKLEGAIHYRPFKRLDGDGDRPLQIRQMSKEEFMDGVY